jgi:hypothetical protein
MGVSGQYHAPAALCPGEGTPRRLGGPQVWTQRLEENSLASVGDRTPVVHSVVKHYTDRATPPPHYKPLSCLNAHCVSMTGVANYTSFGSHTSGGNNRLESLMCLIWTIHGIFMTIISFSTFLNNLTFLNNNYNDYVIIHNYIN